RRYLGAVLAAGRARNGWYAALDAGRIRLASAQSVGQSDMVEPICPDSDPQCGAESDDRNIIVTGSRIPAPANRSSSPVVAVTNGEITNNQMRGVEEGDIVKQINQYLLVLQDGRIFVVDTRAGNGRRLAVADRVNVYRDRRENMWYDEMLVFGDRVLITGYSYRQDATELSVFRLDTASGRLSREGVFYMTSNDYYDTSNYATRLIGDNLVIYTPFEANDMAAQTFRWPVVRRWRSDEERQIDIDRRSRPLFNAAEIYRPVRPVEDPYVHTVSVCPLGAATGERELECRTTAFVGPNRSQWYVTETDAYLWTAPRQLYSYDPQGCDLPATFANNSLPALLYRVPVDGAAPGLIGARGVPPDQFSLHASGGRFRALLKDRQRRCDDEPDTEARLAYLDFPLSGFGATVSDVAPERYTALPGVKSHFIANRFTDTYLVYGSLGFYRRGFSEHSMPPAYAVPVDRPREVRPLPVNHTVLRAEQAGGDIVLTGYRDSDGLFVTLIDLDGRPRVASSVRLEQRYESEGRSHAFNSLIEADGSGVMGLPTVSGEAADSRAAWRSRASDLSFLTVDRRGRLRPVGELERRFTYAGEDDDEDGIPGYECEVSCIDWYGNSRPIFTDGRLFALTGTEMIEGRIFAGEVRELQRLNIALPTTRLAASGGAD
ncbi:MAG TPA: beta-propeller domain-containing protein, partial [Allosphingosinicella sp.]|nr:beta-propeller domain-containing protein [Allosphingosinicella sp.]